MRLQPGTRLGVYEIVSAIGAGGMGEVYRARDSKLHRDVAIKILPERFVTDDDRVARFEREAQALAALSHPNIAIIHGFQESNDVKALVLELVEGPTLADRIALGPIPIDEALPIAQQIAAACEAAHAQGVVHRDLKPSNIKLRPDGTVKVLDFGLAKLVTDESGATGVSAIAALSQSPTLTTPAATQAGVLLGTAAYMAPEQARGKRVDKRADIWAFGCVLFEMLTGTRAFGGDEITDTLAFIITKEPNWSALPRGVPPAVRRVLQRCLQKDPGERLRDIGDARIELKEALAAPAGEITPGRLDTRSSPWRRVLVGTVVVAGASLVTATAMWLAMRPGPQRVTRTAITPSGAAPLTVRGRDLAITTDGTRVVYVGSSAGQLQLFVRALDQLEATPLPGLGTPGGVFLSPDGQWIGFFDGFTALKKVAITGGPPMTLCRLDGIPFGGTWDADGTIVFATNNFGSGLQQVSAAGGEPTALTRPNRDRGEADHLFPRALPDGRGILFTIVTSTGANRAQTAQVAVFDRRTATQKILVRGGSDAQYVASGHLVYHATGTLRASAFDLDRMETVGATIPVVPQVAAAAPTGGVNFDVSRDGTLVYLSGPNQLTRPRTLTWVDRQGHEQPISAPSRAYTYPRVSPDGTRIALDIRDQDNDIWVWDLVRKTLTRLTFDPSADRYPVWTPDGKRVLFGADRAGGPNLFQQAADGTGPAERLSQSSQPHFPDAISPDGARVVLEELSQTGGRDLMMLAVGGGPSKVEPLVRSSFEHRNADLSPDGRYLAYESNESGRFEIYVRPFPNVNGGRWQVSTGGGTKPVWARKGQDLFYVAPPERVMSVRVERGSTWMAGAPTKVLEGPYFFGGPSITGRTYDVSADGQRFLMIKFDSGSEQSAAATSLIVVQNWVEELKRLVPGK